ncbi:gamma-glutamyl-gamma-aminobutyrate hydrolase family protein [Aureimonas altamirensis]|uniref:gamma-glutamyl-gamma-aminobutyrate hydrolase family protein n=1 Tax=Aureimonas altamirensis TaxID=370622 RepID=UPI002036ED4C|nr:gamma-glutamyl-gamma-aminobutyrate hydrolase family protein [Aureimonas altamirensis]MCM2503358.1 gamma-glutamyl-gamma-aminobutyrate hydrolase family protein [Aureimonas altamirensis]
MTMHRPIIAVPADIRAFEAYTWHATPDTYLKAALRVAGVVPLIVPALSDGFEVADILDRVDGVMTTGSATNVHPGRYGVGATASHEPFDTNRDTLSCAMIRGALARDMPLLAICRGHQELNVALGGSLATEIQDIPGRMDHRAPSDPDQAARFARRHPVALDPAGRLRTLIGADTIEVNSLHRQAVDRLADGLVVEARAPDGTVEAVSVASAPDYAFGFQWHPEYWAETDAPSRMIIERFGAACRRFAARRTSHLQSAAE